ncbi:hypothetical protein AG1IA_01013 [Rhizoctonia solani AG-1 IA]|uniref:Uncharacterized protein n=1 Tax=Thanatephorus cucumeris (strain AG1-IA) TaxID=983506 RepID=L8X3S2_THACA|nr:hypothetical protein AG1IA_01013 [Rhizoctonia solani AG-1 IA]
MPSTRPCQEATNHPYNKTSPNRRCVCYNHTSDKGNNSGRKSKLMALLLALERRSPPKCVNDVLENLGNEEIVKVRTYYSWLSSEKSVIPSRAMSRQVPDREPPTQFDLNSPLNSAILSGT